MKPWEIWTGRVLSALPVLLMGFSGVMKLTHNPGVMQGFASFGIPESLITPIGLLELACVVVYLIPPAAVLGAVLITGYLGGAVVTHLRVGQGPVAIAPFMLGVFAWAGLWLRDPRLRALLPLRRP
jgi:DoxX-like protein